MPDSAPLFVAVTDPMLDAPDGAVVTFPNGSTYERIGDEWCRIDTGCTGITASWCPIHGDCSCPRHTEGAMEGEVIGGRMDDPSCPLHDPLCHHAEAVPEGLKR